MKLFLIGASVFLPLQAEEVVKWKIDKTHSQLGFTVKHLLISKVRGLFENYEVQVHTDDQGNIKNFIASAKTKSIQTQNSRRDNHLRSEDFFHSSKYPELKAEFVSFEKGKAGGMLTLELTMRGVTKQVVLNTALTPPVKNRGKTLRGLELTGSVNRMDFEVGTGFLNATVSEEVALELFFELQKI